jgi:dolichol-phosphate mannosyltransferase
VTRPLVSIIVPTFNEGHNVQRVAEGVGAAMEGLDYELIFVDDSLDDTPERLAALKTQNPRVRFEHRVDERGLGTAVVRGFALARGHVLAVLDADGQHPPALLRPLLEAVENGADVAVPSRFVAGGHDGGLSDWRKAVSWVARALAWMMLPAVRPVKDVTSGFFMVRREVVADAVLQPIGWKILIEILVRGHYSRVVEVPYRFAPRAAGESKLSRREMWNYMRHLLALRRAPERRRAALTRVVPSAAPEAASHR